MLRIAHSTQSTLFLCISTALQSVNHSVASSSFKAWRTDEFYYGLHYFWNSIDCSTTSSKLSYCSGRRITSSGTIVASPGTVWTVSDSIVLLFRKMYFVYIPSSDSASEAPLYLESEHEATHPKTCLRSAAKHNTQTHCDPAKLFLLISSEVPRATHVAVLQCLTAIVINSLQPCILAQIFVHFLRVSQSAQSVPSCRFLAQTIIRCTKTSGFAFERWYSGTTQSVHKFAHHCMLKCCSFQRSSDDGST